MKVLVTGATGFFGPEIVGRLRGAGHHVVGASRRGVVGSSTEPLDVTSAESCRELVAAVKPDAVVQVAALVHVAPGAVREDLCRQVNIGGTAHMLDTSIEAGARRFVFISSVIVYGEYDLPGVVTETDPRVAHGIYGESKIEAEAVCGARSSEIDLVVLRMATMYSPDWFGNIRKRVRPFTSGRPLYFSLDPEGRRYSLCSRRNGAEAVLWAVEGKLPPGTYNVADRYEYKQSEIRRAVECADGRGMTVRVPMLVPRLMWRVACLAVPLARWRAGVSRRYWKFCERNVHSPAKLNACGLDTAPDLLTIGTRL